MLVQKELKNAYIGIPNPTSIVLDKSSISLTTIGQTEQLTATIEPTLSDHSITWSSDDTTVATVSTSGLVTCVTPGTCTITATTVNGLTATCSVEQGWTPGANTIAYFPFSTDFDDEMGNRSLTVGGCTISGGYAVVTGTHQYMKLSSSIGGSDITISLWYYYGGNSAFNTLFSRDGGGRHHAIFPGTITGFGDAGTLGFYNDYNQQGWYPGNIVLSQNNWYNIVVVKSGTNQKMYVNGVSAIDSNDSFDNNTNPIGVIGNYASSGDNNQGSIGKFSEMIFESKLWTQQEIIDYFNNTKSLYGIS